MLIRIIIIYGFEEIIVAMNVFIFIYLKLNWLLVVRWVKLMKGFYYLCRYVQEKSATSYLLCM